MIVLIAVFVFLFPQFADYGAAFDRILALPAWAILALIVTSAVNITVYPLTAKAAIARLPYRAAFNSRQVSFLISNVIPGGGPVAVASQYAVLSGYRVPQAQAVATVTADAVWVYLITLAMPSIAVVALLIEGKSATGMLTLAIIGLTVTILSLLIITITLRSDDGAAKIGRILQKPVDKVFHLIRKPPFDVTSALVDFHDHASTMVRTRWMQLTVSALAAQLAPLGVLIAAIYGLSIDDSGVNMVEIVAAYSIALLATMIPLTPGGLGTADAALVGLLTSFGAPATLALAADLIWRLAWFVPQLLSGLAALGWFTWDKKHGKLVDGLLADPDTDPVSASS